MENITIPKGYEAKIEGDKVVFVKKENEDEKIRKNIITYLTGMRDETLPNRMIQPIFDDWIAYLEKQGEQKPKMIQWTGKNLKEVIDFTGKSPRFDEWFKSWEDFENYVHSHGDIFKLFCEDGSHYEVPVGAWIIKTPDGFNTPSRFRFIQKPAEWGEEDKSKLSALLGMLTVMRKLNSNDIIVGIYSKKDREKRFNEIETWLKSLHPQPKQEWNERDDACYETIKGILEDNLTEEDKPEYVLSWFKSHYLHHHWEPCKEQEWSEADECKLNGILADYKSMNATYRHWLKSLPERFNSQAGLSKEDFIKFGNLEYERGKQDGIQSAERVCWKLSEQEKGALSTAIYVLTEERSFPKAAAQLQNILNAFEGKGSRKDWKPSKEQLAALEHSYRACYRDDICSLDDGYQLRELYNKLIEIQ